MEAGKARWLTKRDELVEAKGKGMMQTYWVDPKSASSYSTTDDSGYSETNNDEDQHERFVSVDDLSVKLNRYVSWNLDTFEGILRGVIAQRNRSKGQKAGRFDAKSIEFDQAPLDEVTEMVMLPEFDANRVPNVAAVELSSDEVYQLREYISVIARLYRPNPFHNFEHASHVVVRRLFTFEHSRRTCTLTYLLLFQMATKKLLMRVVNPDCTSASQAHCETYGITSDSLVQLAILFAA